jgi:hypothetical protein
MVTEHALVRRVGRILSMYIGPDEVLLAFDVQFAPEAPATDVASAIAALESRIRERYPRISRIYIEPRTIEVGAPLKSAASAPKATAAPAKA